MQSGDDVSASNSSLKQQQLESSTSYGQDSSGLQHWQTNNGLGTNPQRDLLDQHATADLSAGKANLTPEDAATAGHPTTMEKQQQGAPGQDVGPPLAARAPGDAQPHAQEQTTKQSSAVAGAPTLEVLTAQQQQQQQVLATSHQADLTELRLELSRMQLNAGARIIAATREVRRVHLAAGMRETTLLQQLQAARREATQQLQDLHDQVELLLEANANKQLATSVGDAAGATPAGAGPSAQEATAAALDSIQVQIKIALQLAFSKEAALVNQLQEAQQRVRRQAADAEAALRSASPSRVAHADTAPTSAAAGATS
jgi:hypothetical protein